MRMFLQAAALILGAGCLVYGTAVKGIGSGSRFYLVWYFLVLFFAAVFMVVRFNLWHSFPRPLRLVFYALFTMGFLYTLIMSLVIMISADDKAAPGAPYLLVLGAQVTDSGPSRILYYRLETAYDYLTENPDTVCIVSGGQGDNEPRAEGEAMKDYLIQKGISADRIITETESKNTAENIKNSMALIENTDDTVAIVTNDFHIFRAVSIAKKQGLKNAVALAAPSNKALLPHNVLRECVGVLKDKLVGNL